MTHRSRLNFSLLLLTLAMMLPTLGAANNTERFENLGHRMMCTCSCGQILLECNHVGCPNSDGMRQDLATAVASTNDDTQIINTFIRKYGPTVMAAPVFTGFNRVAWIAPFAVLALLLVGGGLFLRRARERRAATVAAPAPALDDLRARIRRETDL